VQGLAEFLPISSSAHLALTPWLLGWPAAGLAFDVSLHIGTLAAVLWYFRHEWVRLFSASVQLVARRKVETETERRVVFLVIATIPGAIGGLLLNDYAETVFRSPALIATMMIVMGVVLWAVDRYAPQERVLERMRWQDALLIGIAQVLALVPGVSRSGATITGGLLLGYPRPDAARYSFLLAIPAVLLSGAQQALDVAHDPEPPEWGRIAAATGVAFGTGYVVIGWFMHHLAEADLRLFVRYRIALAGLVAALLATGVVHPDDQV